MLACRTGGGGVVHAVRCSPTDRQTCSEPSGPQDVLVRENVVQIHDGSERLVAGPGRFPVGLFTSQNACPKSEVELFVHWKYCNRTLPSFELLRNAASFALLSVAWWDSSLDSAEVSSQFAPLPQRAAFPHSPDLDGGLPGCARVWLRIHVFHLQGRPLCHRRVARNFYPCSRSSSPVSCGCAHGRDLSKLQNPSLFPSPAAPSLGLPCH